MPQFLISIDRYHDDESSIPNKIGGGGSNLYPPALNPEQHTNNRYNYLDEDQQHHDHRHAAHAPATPRNICNPAKNSGSFDHHFLQQPRNNNGMKQSQSRSFFPDSGPRSCCYMMQKKEQNIDWQLAEAVQQVVSLSLDSNSHNHKAELSAFSRYESPNPFPPHRTA